MRTLGLIGGSSWVSTADYYRRLNDAVNARLGGSEYAQCLIYSFNFARIREFLDAADWQGLEAALFDAARRLQDAGAEAIMLCANTLHAVAGPLTARLDVPLLHIADATAAAIRARGIERVGLLGTRPTMEMGFFRERLAAAGIDMQVPEADQRAWLEHSIFDELTHGRFLPATRDRYLELIDGLAGQGAQAVVLACTEIPLLLAESAPRLPDFDTLELHVDAAVRFMLDAG
jgi:aspartate racemase